MPLGLRFRDPLGRSLVLASTEQSMLVSNSNTLQIPFPKFYPGSSGALRGLARLLIASMSYLSVRHLLASLLMVVTVRS